MNKTISNLHVITHPMENYTPTQQARQVLSGGANWIQLRMKKHSSDAICREAESILQLKKQYKFTLIINDHPKIAKQCGADGVHLGKLDCSPSEARKILGPRMIIGGTANSIDDIERLAKQGVDYIGLGPFRFTTTKENLSPVLGTEGYFSLLQAMKDRGISLPVIGIGGILFDDLSELLQTGLHGIAASGSLLKGPDTVSITANWVEKISHILPNEKSIHQKPLINQL